MKYLCTRLADTINISRSVTMKKWFDYQMENQVQSYDWGQYATPITNIKDSFGRPFHGKIKSRYSSLFLLKNKTWLSQF